MMLAQVLNPFVSEIPNCSLSVSYPSRVQVLVGFGVEMLHDEIFFEGLHYFLHYVQRLA